VPQFREASALGVRETQPLPGQPRLQDAILLAEKHDDVGLLSTEPATEGSDQEMERWRRRSLRHRSDRRVGHDGQGAGTWSDAATPQTASPFAQGRRVVFETRALPYAGSGGIGRLGVPKRISVIALMLRFP
jgi:hypothetical protein